jgi:hypothetical protein
MLSTATSPNRSRWPQDRHTEYRWKATLSATLLESPSPLAWQALSLNVSGGLLRGIVTRLVASTAPDPDGDGETGPHIGTQNYIIIRPARHHAPTDKKTPGFSAGGLPSHLGLPDQYRKLRWMRNTAPRALISDTL